MGALGRRIKANLGLKAGLSVVLTGGFCVLYLLLQRHPLFAATEMTPSWLDRAIPFVPDAVYLYESLWLLTPVAPWLMESREELVRYSKSLVLISLAGFSVFLLFPTASPRPSALQDVNAVYGALVRIDRETNAFPSLHAALATLCGASCYRLFDGRWSRCLIWSWVSGVIVSTLLTKQHVVADLVAGVLLGFGGYAVFRKKRAGSS